MQMRGLRHLHSKVPPAGKRFKAMCAVSPADNQVPLRRASSLQRLYAVAKAELDGKSAPGAIATQRIVEALGAVPLSELGLEADTAADLRRPAGLAGLFGSLLPKTSSRASSRARPSRMQYMHIHEEPAFLLGIFCMPPGAEIPLHDHPGMTVFSRVLSGSMRVSSFDWVDSPGKTGISHQAQQHPDRTLKAGDAPAVLFPSTGGNIHAFRSEGDTAVLDLLTPPYDAAAGRPCTYYKQTQPGGESRVATLQACDPPPTFYIGNAPFEGSTILPS